MSYRVIDVSSCVPVVPAEQPAPMLDWVPITKLVIDETYQRDLGPKNWAAIQRIAAEFRWTAFSPVLVAPLDGGRFAVIDGQHRVYAAAICGFERVPAMIALVPRSEQAMAFATVNSRVIRVTPYQVFKAKLASGDPLALACNKAVSDAGCRLMTFAGATKSKKSRQIYALGLVQSHVAAGQAEALTAALSAMAEYDATERVALWSEYILKPWVGAVVASPNARGLDLAGVLRANDPFKVLAAAERAAEQTGAAPIGMRRKAFEILIERAVMRAAMGAAE